MELPPFDLGTFFPYQLASLSERVSKCLSEEYGPRFGLSMPEWRVLAHLAHQGEISIRDIRVFVNLEKSKVSRAVMRLETAGLVCKGENGRDRRLVVISLTGLGREVLGRIVPVVRGLEQMLLAELSTKELEQFRQTMRKIQENLDKIPVCSGALREESL